MNAAPASLSSTVDETLSCSSRFRILVAGNTGVGKSSLIANVFNISQQDIDIADGRAGTADIGREYRSVDNQLFALHDTKGFETGSADHWKIIEEFICQRSKKDLPIEQRLHALWLCIETPRSGSRLMQAADEDLLKLASRRKVPVVVVFTKFDLLYNEFYSKAARNQGQQGSPYIDQDQVLKDARSSLRASIEVFRQQFDLLKPRPFSRLHSKHPISYVGVSTNHQFIGFWQTLEELTEVTRKRLSTKDAFASWAVTQRNQKHRVQLSSVFLHKLIRELPGKKSVERHQSMLGSSA